MTMEAKILRKRVKNNGLTTCKKMDKPNIEVKMSSLKKDLKRESTSRVNKKMWKKPTLISGKQISFFNQFPPDDFES
jgi:hypothetical protein